jgi:hypothetical protein
MTIDKPTPLTLSPGDLNLILAGLAELPFKIAAPVISEIHKQALAYHAQKPADDKTIG